MWLSFAILDNACIIMHWVIGVFVGFFIVFVRWLFLKYMFPTLKTFTDKIHISYVCLYLDYKKLCFDLFFNLLHCFDIFFVC